MRWPLVVGGAAGLLAAAGAAMALGLTRVPRQAVPPAPDGAESVVFPALDGLRLRGWLLWPPGAERAVVVVHGRGQHRADPWTNSVGLARALAARGFATLLFDLRGHGESDGSRCYLGSREPLDVRGAVAFLRARGFAAARIGIIGFSLGAVAALLAAADDDEIGAVVADSPFASLTDMLALELPRTARLPRQLVPYLALAARAFVGLNVHAVNALDAIPRIAPRPLLLIHGEADEVIPLEHAQRLAALAGPGFRFWSVPGAGHVQAHNHDPERYVDEVARFFEQALA